MTVSENNKHFKFLKKLKNKKYRQQYGQYLIESKKLVEEAIKSKQDILEIIVVEDFPLENQRCNKVLRLPYYLFKKISTMNNPEGIMALVRLKEEKSVTSDKILLLDNLNDPGNMGTIIRSAEAFDFRDVLLVNNCVDFYNEKCLRASMGSVFRVNIVQTDIDYIKKLKSRYTVISTGMYADDYKKIDEEKIILMIGNEANGLSEDLLKLSDKQITIPMKGEVESLNAAIAASILMHGLNR